MTSHSATRAHFTKRQYDEFDAAAEIKLPRRIEVFGYNGAPLVGDVRLKHWEIDGLHIEAPDNYFTTEDDGTRPYDVLFVYTPGEHVPHWDYSRAPLIEAASRNPEKVIIDAGCGIGIMATLLGKSLEQRNIDNRVLLIDPNPRAVKTAMNNVRRNGLDARRYLQHVGTLHSALPKYEQDGIAAAYINPPYQARPEHIKLPLHCDGGPDGLAIVRELLKDLIPFTAYGGVISLHTKSPAYDNRHGYAVWPLILDDLVEGKIVPKSLVDEYEIRFSRTCPAMDLYEFYRLVYRGRENDFARHLSELYPLIDMTLMLMTRRKGNAKLTVQEDPTPANPENISWGYAGGKLAEQGHILWHRLCSGRAR